jgi:PAS domain S-box-containing protein
VQQQTDLCGALEGRLQMAEEALSHCNYNLQLTIQIWIRTSEDIEPLLAKRADNSAEIARLIAQIREQAESEEEKQLVDAATPRWSFSEYYGELLRQIVDGEASAEPGAESSNVLLPLLLDQASWKAFVEFLRAQLRNRDLAGEARETMIDRTRELVRQNQVLKSVVAERKRLHERLSQLASIIDCANDAIVVYTLGGTIVSWNAGAERLYGYMPSEVLGRSRYMLRASDQPDDLSTISEKLKRQEPVPLCEAVHIQKGGEAIHVCMSFSPVKEVNGALVGFAAITREISASKPPSPPSLKREKESA